MRLATLFLALAALAKAQDDPSGAAPTAVSNPSGASPAEAPTETAADPSVNADADSDAGAAPTTLAPDVMSDDNTAPPVDMAGQIPQSGINTPDGYAPGAGPGCEHCTIPPGYTNLQIPPPLGVDNQFTPRWKKAHSQAAEYLQDWSLEDKVNLVTGVGWMQGRCVGNTRALPSHKWPGLCMQDSPLGVRFADHVSAFPAAINAAATFDKGLMYARGKAMGQEFRGKGINVALGPMTNMGRVAAGGRNWEGFGGDPWLSGHGSQYTIWGLQDQGVQACVKHYIGNEQERNRTTSSSNIDDRTLREIYGHPFLRAVQSDVASVMCSYNLVNGSWACQNPQVLNGLLKTDYGFGGYVMSDWNGQMSGVQSAINGLDMSMPGDIGMDGGKTSYWGPALVEAVKNGSVSVARLSDMAQRIMAAWYLTGQNNDYPEVNFNSWTTGGELNQQVDVQGDHARVIRKIGAASTILLKNENNALPLNKPRTMAIIGSDMGPAQGGSNGIATGCSDHGCLDGTLAMGWGSGTTNFPYLIDPLAALLVRARQDHTDVNWSLNDTNTDGAAKNARNADVAIVGIASDSGEEYINVDGNIGDRNNLSAWHAGDELVKAVAGANKNTVVVVHSVGPMDVEQWIEHPNVTAVVWAGLPGQESGNALVDVLYGDVNPSGRLPYTIAKKIEDYPAHINYVNTDTPKEPQVNYDEKLNIDYRHFLANNIEPRFGFGFGLSYTTFGIQNVKVESCDGRPDFDRRSFASANDSMRHDAEHPNNGDEAQGDTTITVNGDTTKLGDETVPTFGNHHGGPHRIGTQNTEKLHRTRWTVTAQVTNTGKTDGWAVPQLYLSYPEGSGEPPRVFRDFERVRVRCGETVTVRFPLSAYALSIWDVVQQKWVIPEGDFTARVSQHAFDDGVTATFCPKVGHK